MQSIGSHQTSYYRNDFLFAGIMPDLGGLKSIPVQWTVTLFPFTARLPLAPAFRMTFSNPIFRSSFNGDEVSLNSKHWNFIRDNSYALNESG